MDRRDPAGTHMIGIWHRSLNWAVEDLAKLERSKLNHLHIRSGEHLAAILLTAFLRRPPIEVDEDGGVDLLFDLRQQDPAMKTAVNLGDSAAFEVKSPPGPSREFDAHLGKPGARTTQVVQIRSAADIMYDVYPILRIAGSSLDRKCLPQWSRNVFIVTHPFDHLAVETVDDGYFVANALPPLNEAGCLGLDTVWILWFPDHLTMWSSRNNYWTEMNFRCFNPQEEDVSRYERAPLQEAEETLLQLMGWKGNSPYLFRLRASGTDQGSS